MIVKSTIAVKKETKELLDKFKIHPRQTYDEVINKAMTILNKNL